MKKTDHFQKTLFGICCFLLALTLTTSQVFSQSLGVWNDNVAPGLGDLLIGNSVNPEIMRMSKDGLLVPRLTTTDRDNIISPATSLLIFNTTINQYEYYSGASWVAFGTLSGGTTNYIPKWTSASSLSSSVIYDDGTNVGIGKTTPNAKLDINGDLKTNALRPNWDSDWFSVVTTTEYIKTHNLGTKDYLIVIFYRESISSTYYNIASYYQQPYRTTWNGGTTGACILEQGDNYIKILTGNLYVNGIGMTDLAVQYYKTSGEYRILIWKF